MSTFDDILDAAKALTPEDRLRLVGALWEDVLPADWPTPSREWLAEAQRRSVDFDQGRTTASPWAEVKDRARRQAGFDE